MNGYRWVALAWTLSAAGVFAAPPPAEAQGDAPLVMSHETARQEAAALRRIPRGFRDSAVIVAWSQKAYDVAFAEDQFFTFKGHRAFAAMHLAMHDALNAIVPVYRQYSQLGRDPLAHPIAAAAQAAHDLLVSQYPHAQPELDAELTEWLSSVSDGIRKTHGIALGQHAAAAILALREGDGWDFPGTYTFRSGPGAYQTTPPWEGFVLQPGFRSAKPFGLRAPEQFRPPPPPSLDGQEYAAAFKEVKDFGRKDSAVRTPDQTGYAVWWMEFVEGSVNRLARQLVTRRHLHLWPAARLFALLNMSLYDSYIAVWDAKYEHNHWRPYTAIREAALDTNPATEPDSLWEPLRSTPPFPEYVSAHSAACASTFEILSRTLPRGAPFRMETTTAPPGMPTRSFRSFGAAAAECADSRVRLGWHFRYATDDGLAMGRAVARYVADHHLEVRRTHRASAP
jgi:PAP2 superfamily